MFYALSRCGKRIYCNTNILPTIDIKKAPSSFAKSFQEENSRDPPTATNAFSHSLSLFVIEEEIRMILVLGG